MQAKHALKYICRTECNQGFSLIEILVVILIITILAGVVGLNVLRHPGEQKVKAAKLQIMNFRSALQIYHMEQDRYPTQEQGLEALCIQPAIAPILQFYPENGYLDSRKLPRDPWEHLYIYLAPGRNQEPYEIISYGSDGEPGGTKNAVDISSSDI